MTNLRKLLKLSLLIVLPLISACESESNSASKRIGNLTPPNNGDTPSQDGGTINSKFRIPLTAVSLNTGNDCNSLKQSMKQSLLAHYTAIRRNFYSCSSVPVDGVISGGGGTGAADSAAPAPTPVNSPATGAGTDGSGSNPGSTSGTNNQEAGVNEGDILKVDGVNGNIFVAQGQYLLVVDAFPPENMNILNQIDVQTHIIALYFDPQLNNILLLTRDDMPAYILASDTAVGAPVSAGGGISIAPVPLVNRTKVKIYHYVDDPNTIEHEAPQLIETIDLDGYYQDSRRIQGRLHVITRHYDYIILQMLEQSTNLYPLLNEYQTVLRNTICGSDLIQNGVVDEVAVAAVPEVVTAREAISGAISDYLAGIDLNTLLPQASRIAADGSAAPVDNYLSCGDVYFPNLDTDLGFQVISSLDTDGQNVAASAIVNNSWQSYVSQDNLYLAENNNYWYWYAPTVQQMSIHKVALSATDRPRYKASGIIDGNVDKSFQFSEFNYPGFGSVLRVTSTQRNWSAPIPILPADGGSSVDAMGQPITQPPRSVNHLTLLKDNGSGKLEQVSQIRNIAVNETIRSTRFDGTRAFMVTFLQIDPLFTFDLSDPTSPKLAGALKIPGFSSYIHIYDQNHLLTIGRAGTTSGLNGQMQLQLIDIADLNNPFVVDSVQPTQVSLSGSVSSYSYSEAEYDHHAFAFFNGNLLAVPVQYNYYDVGTRYYTNFSGIMAYRVTPENGFESLGSVDHGDLAYQIYCSNNVLDPAFSFYCPEGYYINWANPRRSVFETNAGGSQTYLYTVSDVGIKAGLLDLSTSPNKKISTISSQVFPVQRYAYYYDAVPIAGAVGATSPAPATGTGSATVSSPAP